MKVIVGSENKVKVRAVREAFEERFPGAVVEGKSVDSGVSEQPLSLEETIEGAINRAKRAFERTCEPASFAVRESSGLASPQLSQSARVAVHTRTARSCSPNADCSIEDCDYSVGVEDGLVKVPGAESGFLNGCVCAIFDGERVHLGISSLFEFPREVNELIHNKGLNANQAAFESGFSKSEECGSEGGIIGLLTDGKLMRKDYSKQAVVMALLHLRKE